MNFTKRFLLICCLFYTSYNAAAQAQKFMLPSAEILALADAPRPPSVSVDDAHKYMLYMYRSTFKALSELGQDEVRLAGLRVNPTTRIASNTTFLTDLRYSAFGDSNIKTFKGMLPQMRITHISWSPKQDKVAFTNTTNDGVYLWLADLQTGIAKQLSTKKLNASMGSPITWLSNNTQIIVRYMPDNAQPLIDAKTTLPEGPAVSTSIGGKASQNRTYPDMLRNEQDEQNFDRLIECELALVDVNGNSKPLMKNGLYTRISPSPDGSLLMLTTLNKPYSYIVPFSRFPQTSAIYEISTGKLVNTVNETPLLEIMPKGFSSVQMGKRAMSWRPDMPRTLYYVTALDSGDQAKPAAYRDAVYTLEYPYSGDGQLIAKTKNRFSGIEWGTANIALLSDSWYDTRNTKLYLINPGMYNENPKILWDRSYDDKYTDPGEFVTKMNEYGRYVLDLNGDNATLIGEGFTAEGQFPFVQTMSLKTGAKKQLYRSKLKSQKEDIVEIIDAKAGKLLVRVESPSDYPNYYVRNMKTSKASPLTFFKNPYTSLSGIKKEVITYKRNDGVTLSGTLYLPANIPSGEKLPLLIWAYPEEFKTRDAAGQSDKNANSFTYPNYGSFIYWVTKGYAVLDDASFPIIGEDSTEPNDNFMPQLIANAEAAINAVDARGVIDRKRVAIGGHSYGAFMTANLLTHTKLFACGIARSGAYNRTLTPFGFQSEQRNYWDVKNVYNSMSPFMNAELMKTPLLLVHGDADNNPGTFTLQTERYFQALKGLGAPVRMVLLPRESHGYESRENIMHLLWEQDQFLEKYLKN